MPQGAFAHLALLRRPAEGRGIEGDRLLDPAGVELGPGEGVGRAAREHAGHPTRLPGRDDGAGRVLESRHDALVADRKGRSYHRAAGGHDGGPRLGGRCWCSVSRSAPPASGSGRSEIVARRGACGTRFGADAPSGCTPSPQPADSDAPGAGVPRGDALPTAPTREGTLCA